MSQPSLRLPQGRGRGGGDTRSGVTGWALAQPRWTRAKPAAVQRGLSRESAPCVPGGLPGSCQVSDCWRFSPAEVQQVPQGSQTLCAIATWHFCPLRVLETWLRTFLPSPCPLWAFPSDPPRDPPRSTHTPGPSCTHSPRPTRAPRPQIPPGEAPRRRSPLLPPRTRAPPARGDPGCSSRSKKHILATEIGYLKITIVRKETGGETWREGSDLSW